ncbi:MAG: hypothetical protein HOE21_09560 [Proteobacteria bacterium]|jgi:hypothetical protein|nr:hypothetical protein [Pseudomonadota bacterium]|tara:strand:- start:326 stop:1216 length:891 start_codon:yes stop_codon:yes gene_type:complete
MHKNVKTTLGIFLFFFFGFLALSELVGSHIDHIKTLDDPISLLTYFKLELFAFVFVPLLFATCWRVWSGESHWSSVWFHSGVPLGILASSISLVGMLQNVSDTDTIAYSIGESLLAIFYGGAVSFIGYLNLDTTYILQKRNTSNLTKFFVLLLNTLLIGAGMEYYAGILAFIDSTTIYIFAACTAAFLLINRDESKSIYYMVCETMVIASLASVIIALISYTTYQAHIGLIGPAVAVGILGPLYGSFLIIQCATFFPEADLREINFMQISWHLLEICGLWILMVFAPMSLLEMFGG